MNIYTLLAENNRPLFNTIRKNLQQAQRKLSQDLQEVPAEEVAKVEAIGKKPLVVWKSRHFLVQLIQDVIFAGTPEEQEYLRLTVSRTELTNDGNWKDGISWDELMVIKSQCGFAEQWAVEVYPPTDEIVNVGNMRHLWLVTRPVFAWSKHNHPADD
ncbi:MAG: hypothetical protein RLZZ214_1107 [Verrucomicrobiota bacterium]|jgi:hypothetical protein